MTLGAQHPWETYGEGFEPLQGTRDTPGAPPPASTDHSPKDKAQMMESVSDTELFFLWLWEIYILLKITIFRREEWRPRNPGKEDERSQSLKVCAPVSAQPLISGGALSNSQNFSEPLTPHLQNWITRPCLLSGLSWAPDKNGVRKNAHETLPPQHTCKLYYYLTCEKPVAWGK